MRITNLTPDDYEHIDQVAALLVEAFRHIPDFVPDVETARHEIQESFGDGRISRVALDENGSAIGWVGGIPQYDGNVIELHPLAIKPSHQRRGIGKALVDDLEQQARASGAITVILGTDDEYNATSLYGQDLYPDIARQISTIQNIHDHPYEFYQKCGYVISGLVPDANGFGKPDIIMAKRVGMLRGNDNAPD
jgi:aminoglycoside 6'-N-acetyltransferase I